MREDDRSKTPLFELENYLGDAANALRYAWTLCKHNEMEATAKELADTVLDVETAYQQIKAKRKQANEFSNLK